jgi:ADP-ribose pyrophosphatase
MSHEILSTEYLSDHKYFRARKDAYQLASGKIVDPYFVVELPTSATAMAITENGEVILVSQYRHPIQESILELPGGFVDKGEAPEHAIRRELLEETGYAFANIYHLGITAANPGVLSNFTHLFLATGGIQTKNQSLDEQEELEIVICSIEEALSALRESRIKQSMHALCMFYALEKLKQLNFFPAQQ